MDDKLSRRSVMKGIVTTGTGLALGQGVFSLTMAQNPAVKIAELSALAKEWDTVPFDYASAQALLVRLPKPEQEDKRVTEVKQGSASLYLSAYQLVCTHQGCTPNLPNAQHRLECPCHGSVYRAADGTVVNGPARLPLRGIKLEVKDGSVFATGFID